MRIRGSKGAGVEPATDPIVPPVVRDALDSAGATLNNAPDPSKNLVIEFGEGFVVERMDTMNWIGKAYRAVRSDHPKAKNSHRWETVGYFGSPMSAARAIAVPMVEAAIGGKGVLSPSDFAVALDRMFERVSIAAQYGERASVYADLASETNDAALRTTYLARAEAFRVIASGKRAA